MDPMALHRKLEPIYELIDSRNNKGALKAIAQLLGKYPGLQIGRVLKGIVVQRMGRDDEGYSLCEEVRAEAPTDDTVLNTLSLFYRNTGRRAEIVAMFEAASEKSPKNVDHLQLLFAAYARDYAFVKQQQCAMKLYRLSNDPRHIMWAVCSMLLQARDNPALLQLAAGMCGKLEAGSAIRDREALLVYARVLREAGKGDKALELLTGDLAETCIPMQAERLKLCAIQAAALGRRDEAATHWRETLRLAPDDWAAMSAALDIAMPGTSPAAPARPPLPAGGTRADRGAYSARGALADAADAADVAAKLGEMTVSSPPTGGDDTSADSGDSGAATSAGTALVADLKAAADAAGGARSVGRGPYLLAVELAWRRHQLSASRGETPEETPDAPGSLAGAMLAYWTEFGAWTSCARDLQPYSARLVAAGGSSRTWLMDALEAGAAELEAEAEEEAPPGSETEKNAVRRLRRVVAAAAVRAQLGAFGGSWSDSPALPGGTTHWRAGAGVGTRVPSLGHCEGRAAAGTLMARYRRAKHLVGPGADPREPTPRDALALLATQALAAESAFHAGIHATGDETGAAAAATSEDSLREATLGLLCAAATAEEGLAASPNHAGLRLGLTSLYVLLGAAGAAFETFTPVDCKNIQMDTMAHHVLPAVEGGAAPDAALAVCRLADILRADTGKDIAEAGVTAYNQGVYTKALEFVDFHRRLSNSHSLAAASVLAARTALRTASARAEKGTGVPSDVADALRGAADACDRSVMDPASDDGLGARCHNEDVTMNPAWLPPYHGQAALAAADWWGNRGMTPTHVVPGESIGRVPVAGVHDAGVGPGLSVAHRSGWAAALRRAGLEMRALRAAAALSNPDAGEVLDGVGVANLTASLIDVATVRRGDGSSSGGVVAAKLAPATAASEETSDAVLASLGSLLGLHHERPDTDDAAAETLAACTGAYARLCERAVAGLTRGDGGVLARSASGTLPVAHHAVVHVGVLVVSALQCWSGAVAPKKGGGKKSGGGGAGVAENEVLVAAVKSAASATTAAIGAVVDAAAAGAAPPVTQAAEEEEAMAEMERWAGPAPGGGRVLEAAALRAVVKRVIEAQRATLHGVRDHGNALVAQLTALL